MYMQVLSVKNSKIKYNETVSYFIELCTKTPVILLYTCMKIIFFKIMIRIFQDLELKKKVLNKEELDV